MKIEMNHCDGPKCNKMTINTYHEKDWIVIDHATSLTKSKGFYDKKKGCYQTYYNESTGSRFDFCSEKCLIKLLNFEKKKAPADE